MLPRIKVLWDLAELYLGVVCLRFGLHVARLWQRPEQALHIRNRHAAEALILASLPRWWSGGHHRRVDLGPSRWGWDGVLELEAPLAITELCTWQGGRHGTP